MSRFDFSQELLKWFDLHGRNNLPWQDNRTPYRVWISEIMLQQTQVNTVIPFFKRFMESYPDINSLSNASKEQVMHHWTGLGYYARARNLHKMSHIIQEKYNGSIPLDFNELVQLPGIGRSTAGAILALSDNQKYAILDGNVKRVLARYHAVSGWPGLTKVEKKLWGLSEKHLPSERFADFTQAIMDLGATLCIRSKPQCQICPLTRNCKARIKKKMEQYPGKKKSNPKPHKQTIMIIVIAGAKVLLEKRPDSGIWGGLFSFPEVDKNQTIENWCETRLKKIKKTVSKKSTISHTFSHFKLDINPIEVRLGISSCKLDLYENEYWYDLDQPSEIGLAAPIKKLLQEVV